MNAPIVPCEAWPVAPPDRFTVEIAPLLLLAAYRSEMRFSPLTSVCSMVSAEAGRWS